jgi:hypothetical protein
MLQPAVSALRCNRLLHDGRWTVHDRQRLLLAGLQRNDLRRRAQRRHVYRSQRLSNGLALSGWLLLRPDGDELQPEHRVLRRHL